MKEHYDTSEDLSNKSCHILNPFILPSEPYIKHLMHLMELRKFDIPSYSLSAKVGVTSSGGQGVG